jgi:hypothetical protein
METTTYENSRAELEAARIDSQLFALGRLRPVVSCYIEPCMPFWVLGEIEELRVGAHQPASIQP